MPCIFINPNILTPSVPQDGDKQIIYGNDNNPVSEEGMVDYFFEYHYSGLFIDYSLITEIPNGANIYKVAINIENTLNGTYPEKQVDIYMANCQPGYTQFPLNMRINLTSSSDSVWNSNIINFTQVSTLKDYTYTQVGADPDINWKPDFLFNTSSFKHTAGNNILIMFNAGDGTFVSGSSSWPAHRGKILDPPQLRRWAFLHKSAPPRYASTQLVNFKNTFIPNIQLFWN